MREFEASLGERVKSSLKASKQKHNETRFRKTNYPIVSRTVKEDKTKN